MFTIIDFERTFFHLTIEMERVIKIKKNYTGGI